MKRIIALVLAITVLPHNPISAATLAGTSCKKVGITKSVKGSLYKCKSVKKKLAWVLEPASTKTTTGKLPSVLQSSSDTSLPTATGNQVQMNPKGAPFTPAEFPSIGAIARDNFKSYSSNLNGFLDVRWDPTTTSAKRSWIGDQISSIEKIYAPFVPSESKITILVIGADKEWAREQLRLLSKDSQPLWDDYNNKFYLATQCSKPNGYVVPDNVYPSDYTTYRALGGGVVPGKAFAFVTMSNCDDYIEKDVMFHEVFHSVQYLNSYKNAPSYGNQSWGWGLLPPWIREGQAQYMGLRMSNNFKNASVVFDGDGAIWWNSGKRWKNEYEYLTTYETGDPYWIGAIMQEYLIAKFGLMKSLEIFDATVKKDKPKNLEIPNRFAPFDEAFLEIFGQSRESFYQEVKPYIQWSLDQQKK